MNILLFDTPQRDKLFPLTLTRAVADIRVGILTIKEKWERITGGIVHVFTAPYLQNLYGDIPPAEYFVVDACVLPTIALLNELKKLQINQGFVDEKGLIAGRFIFNSTNSYTIDLAELVKEKKEVELVLRLEYPFHIFQLNERMLVQDFELLTKDRSSSRSELKDSALVSSSKIFIEEGASVSYSTLNASTGPIYIAKGATVMEGCMIRGPFALCEGATLKMGSKVYGATTLGPGCVGGGEMKNVVMFGYSNKAHDGYLGDSVVGEWCNFGAGTSNSNLKNTASEIKIWNSGTTDFVSAGLKCGVIMGDYSRTAINTSINTGTVIGVCCNVFSEGLTPKLIPNFTWNTKELTRYELDKAFKDIANWKNFKDKKLLLSEVEVLRYIFDRYND